MTREALDVWLYGTRIAQLHETVRGRIGLAWTADAVQRWGRGARLLSAKLTIGTVPVDVLVGAYLDGLLPEGSARVNHALTAGVAPDDTYALIRAYGRDTPGATIFVPAGTPDPTRAGHYEPLSAGQVAERLRRADEHLPTSPRETTESSTLPGMVPKVTIHREGGQWFSCKEGAPSTWILKRSNDAAREIGDVVDTEVACLTLAREIGLTSIDAEIVDFGDVRAIAVSRYDRDVANGNARLHQEDLAQALGLNTQDPNRKFQWGSRMPSLVHAADVLRLDGGNPDALLRLVTFSFLVGNTDMHAKNISFLRHDDGKVALSPAYDIAMHLHHERENRRSALDVNGRNRIDELTIADVVAEAERWGLPARRAARVVAETTRALDGALRGLDRARHGGVPPRAWDLLERRIAAAVAGLPGPATPAPAAGVVAGASERPAGAGVEPQSGRPRGPRRPR
ncbi:HipA domain-containing protein [Nocardioides panacis]|uniref:HipA domain-containing protein n=1 Tax=Nocardioides panacis TaxID=2849501 RepID=A0A975T1H3_9ACTN|nr:HipA domain-containing protein [Nocardioides panacis]QWZ09687.1 HipA domain-containing protein [Nocardioides panacis]